MAAVVLLGLVVCPPLAILVLLVAAPLLLMALALGLLAAVLSTPYLLVDHFRGIPEATCRCRADRLRRAARALLDLAPRRIVADAHNVDFGP